MNTTLLILNTIMDVAILLILTKGYIKRGFTFVKENIHKLNIKKFIKGIFELTPTVPENSQINQHDEDGVIYIDIENDVNNNDGDGTALRYKPRSLFSTDDIINSNIDNTFNSVYDFINYFTEDCLHIIDIANRKIRKVKHLEEINCQNKQTILITFEDGAQAVFFPFLFAKILT